MHCSLYKPLVFLPLFHLTTDTGARGHFRLLLCTTFPPLHHYHLKLFILQFCTVFQTLLATWANLTKLRVTKPLKALSIRLNSHEMLLLRVFTVSEKRVREHPIWCWWLCSLSSVHWAHWTLTQALVRIIFVGISIHLKMFHMNFGGSCHMLSLRATKFMSTFCHYNHSKIF